MTEVPFSGPDAMLALTDGTPDPLIPGRPWSTMDDGCAVSGREILADGEIAERIHAAALVWQEGVSSDVPVWTPPDETADLWSGLAWGYTVLSRGGKLIAFQRIVFVPRYSLPVGSPDAGTFRIVRSAYASAWSGRDKGLTDGRVPH